MSSSATLYCFVSSGCISVCCRVVVSVLWNSVLPFLRETTGGTAKSCEEYVSSYRSRMCFLSFWHLTNTDERSGCWWVPRGMLNWAEEFFGTNFVNVIKAVVRVASDTVDRVVGGRICVVGLLVGKWVGCLFGIFRLPCKLILNVCSNVVGFSGANWTMPRKTKWQMNWTPRQYEYAANKTKGEVPFANGG